MSPQDGLSACEQDVDSEGLDETVVSTRCEELHHVSRGCLSRDDDNRDVRRGSDLREEAGAMAIPQFRIKNYQIGTGEQGRFQSFSGARGLRHREATRANEAGRNFPAFSRLAVDNQNPRD